MGLPNPKYPSTPYWPWSPTIGRGDAVHPHPERFVGTGRSWRPKSWTGGCTLLHAGRVYARSVSAPSEAKWMAMVKKHHAWKVTEPDVWLYGEDIYGVHSIAYDPVPEDRTFHAFALRNAAGGVRGLRRPGALRGEPADSGRSGPVSRCLPVSHGGSGSS